MGTKIRVVVAFAIAGMGVLGWIGCDNVDVRGLPTPCPTTGPSNQSPAVFAAGGVEPSIAITCETADTEWLPCHQHMHCGPEHSAAGICGGADCEVHTVHRRRKDGAETEEVENLHEGTVGGNCDPTNHHLMVRATFLDFDAGCATGNVSNITYCGSATGNNTLDTDDDGAVTCGESGINMTTVRWCIETACVCLPGSTEEEQVPTYGEIEATKVQGCPNS